MVDDSNRPHYVSWHNFGMAALVGFNVVLLLLIAAISSQKVPQRLYASAVKGLHYTIGITTPTDRQVRRTFIAWLIAVLVIVNGMALMLSFMVRSIR